MTPEDDAPPVVGLTGARFGGASRRSARRRQAPVADEPDRPATEKAATEQAVGAVVGSTGARFRGATPRTRRPVPPPAAAATAVAAAATGTAAVDGERTGPERIGDEPVGAGAAAEAATQRGVPSVRPYVLTGGRTRARMQLPLEALVSAATTAVRALETEHRAVLDLCREPTSVAEIAALMGVPLGVSRVLVGDLAAIGAVAVHRTAGAAGPDLALMQRVLGGLRRL